MDRWDEALQQLVKTHDAPPEAPLARDLRELWRTFPDWEDDVTSLARRAAAGAHVDAQWMALLHQRPALRALTFVGYLEMPTQLRERVNTFFSEFSLSPRQRKVILTWLHAYAPLQPVWKRCWERAHGLDQRITGVAPSQVSSRGRPTLKFEVAFSYHGLPLLTVRDTADNLLELAGVLLDIVRRGVAEVRAAGAPFSPDARAKLLERAASAVEAVQLVLTEVTHLRAADEAGDADA